MNVPDTPVNHYLHSLDSQRSRRTMAGCLLRCAELLGLGDYKVAQWHTLEATRVYTLREYLCAMDYAPATVNLHLAAIRGVLRACWQMGVIDHETMQRAVSIQSIKGSRPPAGREVEEPELAALFKFQRDRDPHKEMRDLALMAVLYVGGLRRQEAARLRIADWELYQSRLTIQGKGHRIRTCYLSTQAARILQAWVNVRGDKAGTLFGMADAAIYAMISRRVKRLGLRHLSPHDLRRTFVGNLLESGVDLVTVQRMAGHAQMTTTARYDRRPAERQQLAAETLALPVEEDGQCPMLEDNNNG